MLALVQQICGKIPDGKKVWENMKKMLAIAASVVLLAGSVDAGTRSGGGGYRSSSRSFSRSYSTPRSSYRPSYSPRSSSNHTTVINNGGGSSGMGSGMFWGYLLGQSMSSHPAPAAPTVVVVPSTANGGTPSASVSNDVSTVAPIAPATTPVIEQAPEEGGIGFLGWLMILLGLGGAGWWTYRRRSNGAYDRMIP
ncbi:hypothetical protein [Rhizobium leguminosarum]|uniref:hypothetical protein n=1 Tax=Rhizobium leguminosarum TaxID=384 RepID=UPI001C953150|nr:hypothetical protein [Rhizobium leguminosarum]MBY5581826.1 hypothetical protein [Rhizobium leguminosarum]